MSIGIYDEDLVSSVTFSENYLFRISPMTRLAYVETRMFSNPWSGQPVLVAQAGPMDEQ